MRSRSRLLTVGIYIHGVVLGLEALANKLCQCRIIFCHQNSHNKSLTGQLDSS